MAVENIWREVWNRNSPPTEDGLMSSMRLIRETLPLGSNWHHDYNYTLNTYEQYVPIIWKHTPFTRFLVEGLCLITWIDAVSRFGKSPISETAMFIFLDLLLNAASNVTNWHDQMIIMSQFFPAIGVFLVIPCLSNRYMYEFLRQDTQHESNLENPDSKWVLYHQVSLRFMFQKVVRDLTRRLGIPPSLTGQLDEILQPCQDLSPLAQLLIRLEGHGAATCYQTVSQASFEAFNSILFASYSHKSIVPIQLEEEISSLTRDPTATKVTSLQLAFENIAQLGYGLCINTDAGVWPENFERSLVFSMEQGFINIW